MSYASTIEAFDPDIHPIGSAGSALVNPAATGVTDFQNIESLSKLKSLIAANTADALAAWTANPTPETQAALDQANELSTAYGTLDAQSTSLIHGDPSYTVLPTDPDYNPPGILAQSQFRMTRLSQDMATLSGGEASLQHMARVDGSAARTSLAADVCHPDSLIRKGLKTLTDAGKLLKDTISSVTSTIGQVLGDIKDWTTAKLKEMSALVKSAIGAVTDKLKDAVDTFKGWVKEGADALKSAISVSKNKAFVNFMDATDPCTKDALKEVININNVDEEALARARTTA